MVTTATMLARLAWAQEGEWQQSLPGWVFSLGNWGPWLLAAVAVALVVRAGMRRGRYRGAGVLGADDLAAVHAAITAAERTTVGEIVPVVVDRSDPHPVAAWKCALFSMLLGSTLLVVQLPWESPALVLLCQLGLGLVGGLAARLLPDVARLFISEKRATAVAEEQAFQEFFALGLHKTQAATGVLVFVSLLEHRVLVLGDHGIDAEMGAEAWQQTTRVALEHIARGDLAGGLVAAVQACGKALAEHFPWADGDRNELPDRLVVRRE